MFDQYFTKCFAELSKDMKTLNKKDLHINDKCRFIKL